MIIVKRKHKYITITSNGIYRTHGIKNNKCLDPIINMSENDAKELLQETYLEIIKMFREY